MLYTRYQKDPLTERRFSRDWNSLIGSDPIAQFDVIATGVNYTAKVSASGITSAIITDGVLGTLATVTFRITTQGGQVFDYTFEVEITREFLSIAKDPDAVFSDALEWKFVRPEGTTLSGSSWQTPGGIGFANLGIAGTQSKFSLTGGTLGQTYDLTNQVSFSDGQKEATGVRVIILQK